ncbi:MAG: hypothetical protein HY606_02090 [Planctomycetes bacterium]|nr:hypothetical protein [Planctomycetota bacterium]
MKKFLKSIFVKNLETKGLAFFLAFFVWLYLSFTTSETVEINAAISIKDRDKANGLFSLSTLRGDPIKDSIKVAVTGPRKEIRIIKQREISCVIDPKIDTSKKEIQEIVYQVKELDFNLQEFDSIVTNVLPEQEIRIKFIPFVEKVVPLQYPNPVYFEGTLKEGYVIEVIEISSTAAVVVPIGDEEKLRRKIDLLGGVPVKPLTLSSEGIVTFALELDYARFGSDPFILFKKKPVVRLTIEKKLVLHTLAGIPIRFLTDSVEVVNSAERSVEECSVVMELSEDDVPGLTKNDIYCYVVLDADEHYVGRQKIELPIKAIISSDKKFKKYRINKVIPDTVQITVDSDR